jgi:putative hemolysin
MIDLEKQLKAQYGEVVDKKLIKKFIKLLKNIIHQDEINEFIAKNSHLHGISFLEAILEHFNISYVASNNDNENIPHSGKSIIVANHPIGSLDGLALLKFILDIRPDVKIIVNQLLYGIEPLQEFFIPIDNMSAKSNYKKSYKQAVDWLNNEHLLVIFPAGEVSRLKPTGIKDGKWLSGFLSFAKKTKSSITPIFIDAKNSKLFYSLSMLFKPFGTMMLPREMFNKNNIEIRFKVGKTIKYKTILDLGLKNKQVAKLFKKQTYTLAKKKSKDYIKTITSIAHPQNRQLIKQELKQAQLLGATPDNKQIFLIHYDDGPNTMREIGRLRELTFRLVEEGTGRRMDLDEFDKYYKHLVLWDEEGLEVVGSYRLGLGREMSANKQQFYSATLFNFNPDLVKLLPETIEMGRSFIQPKYWGLRGLDYLWMGIGSFIHNNPHYKYMLGPVTISGSMSENAKHLIADFYLHYFGTDIQLATANNSFAPHSLMEYSNDYKADFKALGELLKQYNEKLPMLYKQYSELCDDKGTRFLAFGIDYDFMSCVDGLILVEIAKISAKKHKRYIAIHNK